ncbi:MAG: hypothetical protein CMF72_15775 [Mameliella sp.]|nr:hypothetical protein [Mameliella sp.]|tara:strand:+ start:7561 stop:7740 length:180 start_codon:yes stop_codon:yes gene_type:complete
MEADMTGLYDEIMQLLHDTRMSVEGGLQEKVSQAVRNVRLAAEAEFQANPAPQGHGIRA